MWTLQKYRPSSRIWLRRKDALRPWKGFGFGTGSSGCQFLENDLEWGGGGALIGHIPSALQILHPVERGTARGAPGHGLLGVGARAGVSLAWVQKWHWLHWPPVSILNPLLLFHPVFPVIHPKHKCDLSLSFLMSISVSSSRTKSKLFHIMYKASRGLPASPRTSCLHALHSTHANGPGFHVPHCFSCIYIIPYATASAWNVLRPLFCLAFSFLTMGLLW